MYNLYMVYTVSYTLVQTCDATKNGFGHVVLSALCHWNQILQLLAGEAEPGDETRRVEWLGRWRRRCGEF